jgi:hypothetical protein
LFKDINWNSEYGRDMANHLCEDILNRAIWKNIIRQVSDAQKNKQPNNNTNTLATATTTAAAKIRGRLPRKRVIQRVNISPAKGAAIGSRRNPG